MRYWELGYPLHTLSPLADRPPRYWIQLFLLSHEPVPWGWRQGRPLDGRPLMQQSWRLQKIMETIWDEMLTLADTRRNHAPAPHRPGFPPGPGTGR